MRKYTEPSCRHLLRQPLVYGVPFVGILILCVFTILSQSLTFLFAAGNILQSAACFLISILSFGGMRLVTKYAKVGWDQRLLFWFERITADSKGSLGKIEELPSDIAVTAPDTLDEEGLIQTKLIAEDAIKHLANDQLLVWKCDVGERGAKIIEIKAIEKLERLRKAEELLSTCHRITGLETPVVYSLYQVPAVTDPLWLFANLSKIDQAFQVIVSFRGVDQSQIKQKIESYRRLNTVLQNTQEVDSEVSFEDASHVLRGLSRGDESIVDASLVIISNNKLALDPHYFLLEKDPVLPILSALGLRARLFRSHLVRLSTATDLIPNILDPFEDGTAILKTLRGKPLYFDPQDSRLDALHWLVSGATGTGKSFFTGLVLLRLLQAGRNIGVLFIDHKRSFKRLVRSQKGPYIEPLSHNELKTDIPSVLASLELPGTLAGIELSDLPIKEKQISASFVLRQVAEFLSKRESEHVLYIVIDECWKFLREDPQGVEEAFREFRKFDAGAIAITQSVKDFISDAAGQSIIQNADIVILLRQKEDVTRYQDLFDLNEPEMAKVKQIKKKKGIYSECLIKTPFLSRFGRLYPSSEEHELLRTDNLRSERVALAKKFKKRELILVEDAE